MRSQDWLISGLELKSCQGYAGTTHVARQNMRGIRTADALTGSRNPSMVPLKMLESGPVHRRKKFASVNQKPGQY
jgi:hypothetical protein